LTRVTQCVISNKCHNACDADELTMNSKTMLFVSRNCDRKKSRRSLKETTKELMSVDNICNKVYVIRGQRVMLDSDLAEYMVMKLNA